MEDDLTAYYRVTERGNGKPRPPWFSLRAAFTSFLRAARAVDARVVVVADGRVPRELSDLVPGEVVTISGGSAAGSFRGLLDVVLDREGLMWLAEDDYVYQPDALEAVRAAARALPSVDYFGVYTPDNAAWHAAARSQPARRGPEQTFDVSGRQWRRAWDSTSTFGVRARALREDAALLRRCSRVGDPWDHACVLAVQGVAPYPWSALHTDLFLRPTSASAGRVVTRPLRRAAVDLAARRGRRTWVAPVVDLATHAELGQVAPGTDWASLARSGPTGADGS